MPPRALSVGIIGCGWVAEHGHLPALARLSEARVVALADPDRSSLDRLAEAFGIERRYPDPMALLEDPGIDAVAICVPPASHTELALASADAGKPFLLEKPPALSLDDWDRLAARADATGVTAMLGLNMRWHAPFRAARELIRTGRLGEIQCLRTALANDTFARPGASGWRAERERGGGALVEMGVHHFDLWRFLLDEEVEEVSSITVGADESLAVAARMRSGVPVSALFSHRTSSVNDVEVFGTAASLRVSPHATPRVLPVAAAPWTIRARVADLRATMSLAQTARGRRAGGFYVASFVAQWRHFAEALTRGAGVETGLGPARTLVQVILAAAASATQGRTVRCEDAPPTLVPPSAPPV